MRYVKFTILGISLLAGILSLSYGALGFEGQGIFLLVACLVPAALCAFGTVVKPTMPRWAGALSILSFLIVGMKTSGDDPTFENVMLLAFLGVILSIVITIRPDRVAQPGAPVTA